MSQQQCDLLVVGAGPAGLGHAFWKQQQNPNLDLMIIDQQDHPGGRVLTQKMGGFCCEIGPQGIRPNEKSDAFLEALGITDRVVAADAAAKMRRLGKDGRLHGMPMGPGGLLSTKLFTLGGKLRLMSEPFRRSPAPVEESLADFLSRRFGPQTVPLAEAMASGVYGGDAHAIEMAAAFPVIAELEAEYGSVIGGFIKSRKKKPKRQGPRIKRPVLATFEGGMAELAETLRQRFDSCMQLGTAATAIERTDGHWQVTLKGDAQAKIRTRQLALAIPASEAAALLDPVDRDLAKELDKIPFASITNVYLGYRRAEVEDKLQGFGFLLCRSENSPILGAIYCSALFHNSADPDKFLVRCLAGGAAHPSLMDLDEEAIAKQAREILRKYAGLEATPIFQHVVKVHDAIPQYVKGHGQRLRRIRELESKLKGLHLIGNSYDEISVVGQLGQPDSCKE